MGFLLKERNVLVTRAKVERIKQLIIINEEDEGLVDSTPPNEQDKTWPSTSREKLIILKEEVNLTWGPNWNA